VARSLTTDHDAAMDGYAHVLERLREHDCRRLRGYAPDGRTKFTTWLVVVARRLCLDFHRHRYGRSDDPAPDAAAARAARRRLAAPERARVEEHPAACAACRAEVVAVTRLTRSIASRRRWAVMAPLAAAAAVLVLLFAPWQRPGQQAGRLPVLREPAVTATVAPTPIVPRGGVATLPA